MCFVYVRSGNDLKIFLLLQTFFLQLFQKILVILYRIEIKRIPMKLQPIRLKATDEEDTDGWVAGQTLTLREAGPDRIVWDSPVRRETLEQWAKYTDVESAVGLRSVWMRWDDYADYPISSELL